MKYSYLFLFLFLFTSCEDPKFADKPFDNGYDYDYTLLAWSEEGMHQLDKEYSVFSLNPPYTTINAQLVSKTGKQLVASGITLTYEPIANANGAINTTSANKTNFWDYILGLFGVSKLVNSGLTDKNISSTMEYNTSLALWQARGIPLTALNDTNRTEFYPTFKIVAKDASNVTLAHTTTVTATSDEMGCFTCHNSSGFRNDANISKTGLTALQISKLGILELHDYRHATALVTNFDANRTKSLLCSSCHSSKAPSLENTLIENNHSVLSNALHTVHKNAINPSLDFNYVTLEATTDNSACTICHASGTNTHSHRDSMSKSSSISCQSCHGPLSYVGESNRTAWVDMPNCGSCHQSSTPSTSVFSTGTTLRTITTTTFAQATSTLYKNSKGHASLACSACHGTSHVVGISDRSDDNAQNLFWQGVSGTLTDCMACHTTMPSTKTGGPHGMHTIGQSWLSEDAHGNAAESNITSCKVCHGADDRGTRLSTVFKERVLSKKSYAKGEKVGCYDCHNGPNGDDD